MDDKMGYRLASYGKEYEKVEPVANGSVSSVQSPKHMQNRGTPITMWSSSATVIDLSAYPPKNRRAFGPHCHGVPRPRVFDGNGPNTILSETFQSSKPCICLATKSWPQMDSTRLYLNTMETFGPTHWSELPEKIQPMGTMANHDVLANGMGSLATKKWCGTQSSYQGPKLTTRSIRKYNRSIKKGSTCFQQANTIGSAVPYMNCFSNHWHTFKHGYRW